jgi:2-oxoglutarate ferredoxin oxidoreductase subunit alpha
MVEAIDILNEEGVDVRFVSVPYIYPRPDLSEVVDDAEDVIVVECNETGQFADLVEYDVLQRVQRVNKYNGVRFKADELAADIKETLGTEATA